VAPTAPARDTERERECREEAGERKVAKTEEGDEDIETW